MEKPEPTPKKDYPLPFTHPPCPDEDTHGVSHRGYGVAVRPELPMIIGVSVKYHWVCLGCGKGWWQGNW